MSFSIFELSRLKGRPLNLYYFKVGPGPNDYYAFNDGERELTLGGIVYTPTQIKRGSITSSGSLDKSTLDIQMPRTNPIVELFRVYPPNSVVTVIVRQGHYGDTDNEFKAIWSGRIINFEINVNEASFGCEPVGTSTRRPALRRNFQYGCPHALYGPQCNASKGGQAVLVAALTGSTVTLPAGWNGAFASEKYVGGVVDWTPLTGARAVRTIIRVTGDVLTLAGITQGLSVGSIIGVVVGCNHQMSDCGTIHNNILNYGGQPWIPTVNPVGNANQYY